MISKKESSVTPELTSEYFVFLTLKILIIFFPWIMVFLLINNIQQNVPCYGKSRCSHIQEINKEKWTVKEKSFKDIFLKKEKEANYNLEEIDLYYQKDDSDNVIIYTSSKSFAKDLRKIDNLYLKPQSLEQIEKLNVIVE